MIKDDFCDFCNNIKLDNFEDMQTTVKGITKKLNKHYYDIDDDESNMYIVGSVGRTTAIKNTSDLDILFNLPKSVYDRINDNDGNKQSQLLQEVKNVLKEKYPNTDLKGDGQVVVINFTKYTVELVPGFKQNDDSFKYPDTNDGGSWKITNPIPEIDECKKKDDEYTLKLYFADSNEDIWNIAKRYNTSAAAIEAENEVTDGKASGLLLIPIV